MSFDSDFEPWFQPPGWVIGPIWLILYSMIAISFMIMLSKKEEISNSNMIIIPDFWIKRVYMSLVVIPNE